MAMNLFSLEHLGTILQDEAALWGELKLCRLVPVLLHPSFILVGCDVKMAIPSKWLGNHF